MGAAVETAAARTKISRSFTTGSHYCGPVVFYHKMLAFQPRAISVLLYATKAQPSTAQRAHSA